MLLVRLARPLPGPIPRALNDRLAHRHLELLLDGLRADRDGPMGLLPEPALTLADLQGMAPARPGGGLNSANARGKEEHA
jgi:hypothetical protein